MNVGENNVNDQQGTLRGRLTIIKRQSRLSPCQGKLSANSNLDAEDVLNLKGMVIKATPARHRGSIVEGTQQAG
jgi:hypothetical protein